MEKDDEAFKEMPLMEEDVLKVQQLMESQQSKTDFGEGLGYFSFLKLFHETLTFPYSSFVRPRSMEFLKKIDHEWWNFCQTSTRLHRIFSPD